jgi:large subunit ribosomal protein L13
MMKKQTSYYAKKEDLEKEWFVVDATDEILGRLASFIASILRGKHKPTYTPSVDTGDFVIITNAEKVAVTGNKKSDKKYYRHSRYPGGLKETTFEKLIEKKPEDVLYRAIKGMLPHNRIGRQMLTKVKIYAGENHPHESQNPKSISTPNKELV